MAVSSQVSSIVLFISLGLFLAFICRDIKKKFRIPVTFSLMVLGVLFRVIGPYIGGLSQVVDTIKNIDQTVINYVLPVLIFEGAMSKNWYKMRKEIFQIIILATTLVMLNTALTAMALRFILGYDYSWYKLLLLGVVLSSTDNIAVDAILNELYMPENLKTLIVGETMWNEATVFVLFTILYDSNNDALSIAEKFGTFLRLSIGGLVLGLSFGITAGLIIKRMLNELFLETNTLLVTAYLLYWACEGTLLRVSGGLALVTYGLYISAYGRTIISPEIETQLGLVIQIGARNVEGLMFIISGILLANVAIYEANGLAMYDYFSVLIFFPLNYIIRAISLLAHYPLLRHTGYGINWKEYICLTFSGIKGIIATALSLVLLTDDTIGDHKFQNLAGYFGIATAGLTIVIGGLMMKSIVKLLGFEKIDDVQENMLLGITKALIEATETKIHSLSNEKDLKLVNWEQVIKLAGPESLIESVLNKSKLGKLFLSGNRILSPQELLAAFAAKFTLSKHSLKIEMRRRYLSTLKGLYLHFFKSGLCHGDTSLLLIDSCNMSIDKEEEQMKDWEIVYKHIYNPKRIRSFSRFSKMPILGRVSRKLLYTQIILAYDATQTFIKCHNETEEIMDKIEIDIDKGVFDEIIKEADDQVEYAEKFLKSYILDCYPEVLAEIQTKRSCKNLFYMQKKMINKIYEQGLIKEVEYQTLNKSIEASTRTVTFQGFPKMPILRDILINRFSAADKNEINYLISRINEVKVEPLGIIFEEREPAEGAFFIIRGRVKETSSWIDQELIMGNIVGVQHLLDEFSQFYTSTSRAVTYTILAHIPKDIITMPGFVSDLYKEASEEILLLNRAKFGLLDIEEKYILRVASASKVESVKKGKKMSFMNGAIVLKGQPLATAGKNFISPNNKLREIQNDSILMIMPEDFILSYSKEITLGKCFVKFCVKTNIIVRTGTKDGIVEDLNGTDLRIDDNLIFTNPDDLKKPVTFQRRTVVPEHNYKETIK